MRRAELIFNLVFLVFPFALGIIVVTIFFLAKAMSSAPMFCVWGMLALYATGFLLFLKAKLSVILSGKLVTFGAKPMSQMNKSFYVTGYSLMVLALLLMMALVIFVVARQTVTTGSPVTGVTAQ